MPPVMNPLSGRVPGRVPEPSRSLICDGGDDGTFRGIMVVPRGFPRGTEYIVGRVASDVGQGATPCLGAARGWPTPGGGLAAL
jgi:hypothetical protein